MSTSSQEKQLWLQAPAFPELQLLQGRCRERIPRLQQSQSSGNGLYSQRGPTCAGGVWAGRGPHTAPLSALPEQGLGEARGCLALEAN